MKIVDITKENVSRKEKLGKVEKLAKKFFNDCQVSSFENSMISIYSFSGKNIAYISLFLDSGSMMLMDKKYEDKAIAFVKEYEEKIMKKSPKKLFSSAFKEDFLLKKDYSKYQ
jgi:hypothetical protein